jgi:hypothetical protein
LTAATTNGSLARMEATLPLSGPQAADWVQNLAAEQVQDWLAKCDIFRQWERENLLLVKPPDEVLKHHRKASRFMIATTRVLLGTTADPEFFNRKLYNELRGTLRQLEIIWDMLHNPMPKAEADAILKKAFPE